MQMRVNPNECSPNDQNYLLIKTRFCLDQNGITATAFFSGSALVILGYRIFKQRRNPKWNWCHLLYSHTSTKTFNLMRIMKIFVVIVTWLLFHVTNVIFLLFHASSLTQQNHFSFIHKKNGIRVFFFLFSFHFSHESFHFWMWKRLTAPNLVDSN